jgi:hypothetical protein
MENQPTNEALSLTGVSFSRKEKPLVQIPPSAPHPNYQFFSFYARFGCRAVEIDFNFSARF